MFNTNQPIRKPLLQLFCVISILFAAFSNAFAVQYFAVASDVWTPGTATSTIFNTSGCFSASQANRNPVAADDIRVCGGVTLFIQGNVTVNNLLIDSNAAVCIQPSFTLTIRGTLTNYGTINCGGRVVQYYTSASPAAQWTAPEGVTSVDIEAWGGGGGGGSAGNVQGAPGAGGGAGGAYSKSTNISVVPGTTYTFTIGNGGAGGSASSGGNNGNTGSDSYFSNTSTVGISNQPSDNTQGVWAKGGGGGNKPVAANTGGTGGIPVLHALDNVIGGNYGSIIYIGGYGADAPGNEGGGGGGSGGYTADGNFTAAGIAQRLSPLAVTGGGIGGNGGAAFGSGVAGGRPGGGGGGSSSFNVVTIPAPPYADTIYYKGGDGGGGQMAFGWSSPNNCMLPIFTTCPSNMYLPGNIYYCSGDVNYTAIALGNPAPTYTYRHSNSYSGFIRNGSGTGSGSVFYVGYNNVTITATNACGSITCNFTIYIGEAYLECPFNQVRNTNPETCTYTAIGNEFDPINSYTCYGLVYNHYNNNTSLSGATFPSGTTTVRWEAGGWTCTFNITVNGTKTITATASTGGNIINSGAVNINCGSNASFTIVPDSCYYISDVLVDSVSVGPVSSYTFTNVKNNHTIHAIFDTWSLSVTSDEPFCGDTTGTLTLNATAEPSGTYSYSWTGPAGFSSALQNPVIPIPSQTSVYTVTVTDSTGCSKSKTITITSNPRPSATITVSNDTLHAPCTTGNCSYQWFKDGIPVCSDTTYCVLSGNGSYHVIVTNTHGCTYTPPPFLVTQAEEINHRNYILLYPNPNNGSFEFVFTLPLMEDAELSIYNILGERIKTYSLSKGSSSLQMNESFPPGTYFYKINSTKSQWVSGKFIVIR